MIRGRYQRRPNIKRNANQKKYRRPAGARTQPRITLNSLYKMVRNMKTSLRPPNRYNKKNKFNQDRNKIRQRLRTNASMVKKENDLFKDRAFDQKKISAPAFGKEHAGINSKNVKHVNGATFYHQKIKPRTFLNVNAAPFIPQAHQFTKAHLEGTRYGDATQDKRFKIFTLATTQSFLGVARGWYAAIRKSCIQFGPYSLNDKYFPAVIPRHDSATIKASDMMNSHCCAVLFLYNVIAANYNNLIMNDVDKMLTKMPKHIAFMIKSVAKKYVVRVKNGINNIAGQIPQLFILDVNKSYINKDTAQYKQDPANLQVIYIPPQQLLSGVYGNLDISEMPILLNVLYSIQQHEKYPFQLTDSYEDKLMGLISTDSTGKSEPINLNLSEISSLYGVVTYNPGTAYDNGGVYMDLSGLQPTDAARIYQTMFYATTSANDFSDNDLPDPLNLRREINMYYNNRALLVYFGYSGKVPCSSYFMSAEMPVPWSTDDLENRKSVNSKGLQYLSAKYNSNNTRPSVYRTTTRAVKNFPDVNINVNAYNLALLFAQKLQNRTTDFVQKSLGNTFEDGYLNLVRINTTNVQTLLVDVLQYNTSAISEIALRNGTVTMQYDNRFVLPSPIIEDFKPYNPINAWSYKGSQLSVAMQLCQIAGNYMYENPTSDVTLSIQQNLDLKPNQVSITSSVDNKIFQTYDGQVYNPENYLEILTKSDNYLNEIRPYVKLNNTPEYDTQLPSIHTMYLCPEAEADLSGYTRKYLNVFTPMDSDDYSKKNVAIFLKVALLPVITVNDNINVPMINVTNLPDNYLGGPTAHYQEKTLFQLYQYSLVAQYEGASSELDFYYQKLRDNMIGSWSDLMPMFKNVAGDFVRNGGLGHVYNMSRNIATSGLKGANGDMMQLLNTLMSSIQNHSDDGSLAVNMPAATAPPKKKSFWSKIGDFALSAAPKLLSLL